MALAPVDYGPQVGTDTSGVAAEAQATAQREQVFAAVHQLGSVVEGGAQAITQGMLHTQALKATAAVKERQASTLQFIDSNPYVPKAVLQQRMTSEDYEAWHASLGKEYQDAQAVPMFTAAGALFDSEARQARDQAGQIISLPGWREGWNATEQTESATIRERYVNRLAADQMIADQRSQALLAIDGMADNAVKPEDLDTAAAAARTNPWLKPAERRYTVEKVLAAKDSFVARQAMLAGDTEVMHTELLKLKADNSAELYPNLNVKQRLDLANQLTREYGYKAAKDTAHNLIVGPNVDENGKVNSTSIAKALAAYNGPNKEDVTKAVKQEEAERLAVFDSQMSEIQQKVFTAGQDPLTGEFSMTRAMQSPATREMAAQLNRDAPAKLAALAHEDNRIQAAALRQTRAEQVEARRVLVAKSAANLELLHKMLDDPAQTAELRALTPAQFDSKLYDMAMTEPDRSKARTAFKALIAAGKPDERPQATVRSELLMAANGDGTKAKQLAAKYEDKLVASAHAFIRSHPELTPDKMTDALRTHVRNEMMPGKVKGTGYVFDDSVRRIDFETNPDYAGKMFQAKDGGLQWRAPGTTAGARVRLTSPDGKQSGTFAPDDVAEARANGWK